MRELVTAQGLRVLDREIAPFGMDEALRSGVPLVDNPDSVLAYVSEHGEETYRVMRRTEPAIGSAIGQRVHSLLTEGSRVEAGPSGTQDAQDLKDWSVRWLKEVRAWPVVLRRALDAVYEGWRPINLTWRPFEWRGGVYWGVRHAREKQQDQYRFLAGSRDLAYIGDGFTSEARVFRSELDRLRWLICTAGSTDNPYGHGVLRDVFLIWYVKNRFLEMWSIGMGRSLGVIKATEQGSSAFGKMLEASGEDARATFSKVVSDLQEVLATLASSQILVERAGWALEFLSNTAYADGWKHPLEYCDELLRLGITHESLTMKVGNVGSKAAAETHRKSLLDLAKSDGKELESWVNDGLLARAIELNWGQVDEEDMPRWRTLLGRHIDPEKVAVVHQAGIEIDWKSVSEGWNVPVVCDPETGEVLRRATPSLDEKPAGESEDPADDEEEDEPESEEK